jgi:hypothetical protein
MMVALQESDCGYAMKPIFNTKEAFHEVRKNLSSSDSKELTRQMITEGGLEKLSNEMKTLVLEMHKSAMQGGIDQKTACGMVISNTTTVRLSSQTNSIGYP